VTIPTAIIHVVCVQPVVLFGPVYWRVSLYIHLFHIRTLAADDICRPIAVL